MTQPAADHEEYDSHVLESIHDTSLQLCQGENWLQLATKTGGLDLLADTQDANVDGPNASILSLEELGTVLWPTEDTYICFDVDGNTVTVKDMRTPQDEDVEDFMICLQRRKEPLLDDDTVDDDDGDDDDEILEKPEQLDRRQMRLLHPGDRICTIRSKSDSDDDEQVTGELGLVLTYRRYRSSAGKCNYNNNNTQVSQLTMSSARPLLLRQHLQLQAQQHDSQLTVTEKSESERPISIDTAFRPGTQEEELSDDDDGEATQHYPVPLTQSPRKEDPAADGSVVHISETIVEAGDGAVKYDFETNGDAQTVMSVQEEKEPTKDSAMDAETLNSINTRRKDLCEEEEKKEEMLDNGKKTELQELGQHETLVRKSQTSSKGDAHSPTDTIALQASESKVEVKLDVKDEKLIELVHDIADEETGATDEAPGVVEGQECEKLSGGGELWKHALLTSDRVPQKLDEVPKENQSKNDHDGADSNEIPVTVGSDDETVLEEDASDNFNSNEDTQPLPDSSAEDAVVDKVPSVPEVMSEANGATVPQPADDKSDSTALTDVDEKVTSRKKITSTKVGTEATDDDEAIDDPEHARISPFSPLPPLFRGNARLQQTGLVESSKDNSSDQGAHLDATLQAQDSNSWKENAKSDANLDKPSTSVALPGNNGAKLLSGHTCEGTTSSCIQSEQETGLARTMARKRKASPSTKPNDERDEHQNDEISTEALSPIHASEASSGHPTEHAMAFSTPSKEVTGSARKAARKRKAAECASELANQQIQRRSSPRSTKESGQDSQGSSLSRMSIASRKRLKKEAQELRILVTGVKITPGHRSKIRNLGGVILESAIEAVTATHVIASDGKESIRRTPKLMIAICKTSQIVTTKWLDDSAKKRKVLPTRSYLVLNDTTAEKKYDFCMADALQQGGALRDEDKTLLNGRYVYVCAGVAGNKAPPEEELKLIVDAAGGKWVSPVRLKNLDPTTSLIITSDPATKSQLSNKDVARALKNGVKHFSTTWLFGCIMSQELKGLS